tara:strand:+ start:339 stop:752 length:414 start_codon:yes stop_codon:yes gene_type:complete
MSWLTWGATKLFLAKAWIWSKHHWKIIALVVWTIAIWFVSRKSSRAMLKVLQTSRKSYEDEVEVLNKTHAEEQKKKAAAIDEYHKLLGSIEKKYKNEKDKLTFEKRVRIKELIESYGGDKESLNNALMEEFGFEYVE